MQQFQSSVGRARFRLCTAIVLFLGMVLILLAPYSTGVPIHEWAGFLIVIPLFAHVIVDWQWIVTATKRFFRRQPVRTRFNYFWDWLLFVSMTIAVVSGVLISRAALPAIGIPIKVDHFWTTIHVINSRFLMMMLGVHIAMHLNWIVSALRLTVVWQPGKQMESQIDVRASSPNRRTVIPILIMLLAAGVVTLAVLPWSDAEWADGFRKGGKATSEDAAARPRGIETTLTDLYWGALIMGIPALITLGILLINKLLKRTITRLFGGGLPSSSAILLDFQAFRLTIR